MEPQLILSVIGITLMFVGVVFNIIPKIVNKKINPNIPKESENIAATFRLIIGGLGFCIGLIAFLCRTTPYNLAVTLLLSFGVGFLIIAFTIVSVKFRGFDDQIAISPVIMFVLLAVLAFYTYDLQTRNKSNVLVVLNHIKYEKNEEFSRILFNKVLVAAKDYKDEDPQKHNLNQKAINSMSILKPEKTNSDSTWPYIMLADPYTEGASYNIGPSLKQKYGEESAKEVFNRWSECFNAGQEVYLFTKN